MSADIIVEWEEKRLKRMPPRELSEQLMHLPARRRMELILDREDAEAVVAAMPEQDFYVTVKEIGADDALPLLALAQPGQLTHMFDLDCWRKDRLLPAQAAQWLERLAEAGESRVLMWLYQADYELLLALFQKWLRVRLAPAEDEADFVEAQDQLPRLTLDNQFFWEAHYPQYEPFFKNLLGFLFETHYDFYQMLMNHILVSSEIEMEEDAYRFHRGRLEDRAIPDFFDALIIYEDLRGKDVPRDKQVAGYEEIQGPPPSFALALVSEEDLLGSVLKEIDDPRSIEAIQTELAAVANKVVVADQVATDEPENLRQAAQKAIACVNLGLHLVTSGERREAVKTVEEVYLEYLFRVGQTPVASLHRRTRSLRDEGWPSRWPGGVNIVDEPWQEAMELLLARTPQVIRTSDGSSRGEQKDFFRTPSDLSRARRILEAIKAMEAVWKSLAAPWEHLEELLWPEGYLSDLKSITLGSLIWTGAANARIYGGWEPEPLNVHQWPQLFPHLLPDALEATIRTWIKDNVTASEELAAVERYLDPLFGQYREEMAPFSASNPPEPQYVRFFLFKNP